MNESKRGRIKTLREGAREGGGGEEGGREVSAVSRSVPAVPQNRAKLKRGRKF